MKFPAGNYDDEQLRVLMSVFELACKELGIPAEDEAGREQIASTLMILSRTGQADPETLKRYAIAQFEGHRGRALRIE